jgi:DNA-binding NarL/FixJ family response regulator
MSVHSDCGPGPEPMSLVLVDDSVLFRQGLAGLLTAAGQRVVAELANADALPAVMAQAQPNVVVMDVRMPPTHTDEGIAAAQMLRAEFPKVGVLVLSTYAEPEWARRLMANGAAGLGYLLKDRVDDVPTLIAGIRRVSAGGTAIDPEIVAHLLSRSAHPPSDMDSLSPRELETLALMAEGLSNAGIGAKLYLSSRTVEAHIASIFDKLPLQHRDASMNRRVLAVLAYLSQRDA